MSNPGEWIDFEELVRRVPTISRKTLNRRVADGSISSRQLVKRGKREFNWRTVERELQAMERRGKFAAAAENIEMSPQQIRDKLDQLTALCSAMAEKLGVSAPSFAGEQTGGPR